MRQEVNAIQGVNAMKDIKLVVTRWLSEPEDKHVIDTISTKKANDIATTMARKGFACQWDKPKKVFVVSSHNFFKAFPEWGL